VQTLIAFRRAEFHSLQPLAPISIYWDNPFAPRRIAAQKAAQGNERKPEKRAFLIATTWIRNHRKSLKTKDRDTF
jgi:hypothetical protein